MRNIDFSKTYSYSKISLFEKCPKEYYFNYLDPEISLIKKYFKKQTEHQTKGSAVHGAITLFHHLPLEKRTFKNLKDFLYKAWFAEKDIFKKPPLGELGGFKDLDHERKVYGQALALLKNFFEMPEEKSFHLNNKEKKIFYLPTKNIKESFKDYEEMIKPLDRDVLISGKFDRIDSFENGDLEVIDYKTGKNQSDHFQLYFYKLLAEINFKKKVSSVSFYCLNNGKVEKFNVSNVSNEKIKGRILKIIEKIKNTKKFLPKKNRMCNYCDFQEICPSYNSLSKIRANIKKAKESRV